MTRVFGVAKLMQKVIKAYACDSFYTSMSTSMWTCKLVQSIQTQKDRSTSD